MQCTGLQHSRQISFTAAILQIQYSMFTTFEQQDVISLTGESQYRFVRRCCKHPLRQLLMPHMGITQGSHEVPLADRSISSALWQRHIKSSSVTHSFL